MGYYSEFSYTLSYEEGPVVIDPQLKKQLEAAYANAQNKSLYGFYEVKLVADKDNILQSIELSDYISKFYDDRYFAKDLSKIILSGYVILRFIGEEGEKWEYYVRNNQVDELSYEGVPYNLLKVIGKDIGYPKINMFDKGITVTYSPDDVKWAILEGDEEYKKYLEKIGVRYNGGG